MKKIPANKLGSDSMRYIARCLAAQHSQFFRPLVFHETWKILLQDLRIRLGRSETPIKIAVIGCSAGEEVYSLAMALHHKYPPHKVALRGIDKNPQILLRAQSSLFKFSDHDGRLNFFDQIPQEYRRYFHCLEGHPGIFKINPLVQESIQFQKADVTEEFFSQNVPKQDIVVINNVFVHITEGNKAAAVDNLVKILALGGRMIVDTALAHPDLSSSNQEKAIRSYLRKGERD